MRQTDVVHSLLMAMVIALGLTGAAQEPWTAYADGNGLYLMSAGEVQFRSTYPLWGPGWAWTGYRGGSEHAEGHTVWRLKAVLAAGKTEVELQIEPRQTGPAQLTMTYRFSSSQDAAVTLAAVSMAPFGALRQAGATRVYSATGDPEARPFPYGRQSLGTAVTRLQFGSGTSTDVNVHLSPAVEIQADREARLVLARDRLPAARPYSLTLVIDVPGPLRLIASPADVPADPALATWFPWTPAPQLPASSVIGMEDWLEAPAGRQGRIAFDKDRLTYGGKPVKLWGLNLCYGACAPPNDLADRRAKLYARYGINAVRLHKYADGPGWAGIQATDSFAGFDPAALDLMDYQVARFKEHGIYVTLSPTFGTLSLGAADREAVPFMDELGTLAPNRPRVATPHGSLYLASELQDLQIRQMVTLLRHRNPHTGLTYAADPAVAVIEVVNEHSALFYSVMACLQKVPALRQRAASRFSGWLAQRYGDEAGLRQAWGDQALNSFAAEGFRDESLAAGTVVPAGNPWFYDPTQLAGSQGFRRQRLLDTMRFFYELQNEFYARWVKAVRDAGYEGAIVASNWQAGRGYSHYLNLHSDALVGIVDRHNYVGGTEDGWIKDTSLLTEPGSGLLSAGLQQVADRPFMLSEWIHCYPNEWGVEGPALVGAYGMGLQGWDASFMFQNRDEGTFSSRLGRETWDVTAPHILGVLPAVSRHVLRGDVREADPGALRYVHVPSLFEGRLGFEESVQQQSDVKAFGGVQVPARALAATRVTVAFTESYRETPAVDLTAFLSAGVLTSATRQLQWRVGLTRHDGHVTINTPGTKAVIGFAAGRRCDLGEVTITPRSPFAAIYLTARERDRDVASAPALLVTTIARARNTGTRLVEGKFLAARGQGPVLLEPVSAEIRLRRPGTPRVIALDHDGCLTTVSVPVSDGMFVVDGATYRTAYYEVRFE